VGWEKVACWSTKAAISVKHVKIEEKLLRRAYRNLPIALSNGIPASLGFGWPQASLGWLAGWLAGWQTAVGGEEYN